MRGKPACVVMRPNPPCRSASVLVTDERCRHHEAKNLEPTSAGRIHLSCKDRVLTFAQPSASFLSVNGLAGAVVAFWLNKSCATGRRTPAG
jgi:hypothetical protein